MNFNETPKLFEPSQEQAPVPGIKRRSILRALFGLGAVAAGVVAVNEVIGDDPMKESSQESIKKLLEEMKESNVRAVHMIEASGNTHELSSRGWVRLGKIMKERGIKAKDIDSSLSISQLETFLSESK